MLREKNKEERERREKEERRERKRGREKRGEKGIYQVTSPSEQIIYRKTAQSSSLRGGGAYLPISGGAWEWTTHVQSLMVKFEKQWLTRDDNQLSMMCE